MSCWPLCWEWETEVLPALPRSLRMSFTRIKLALVVGICGGAPYSIDKREIILGDVIISDSVVEYDFGRQYPDGFVRKSGIKETLGQPNQEIRSFLNGLRTSRRQAHVQQQIAHYLEDIRGRDERHWSYPGVPQDTILFPATYRHRHYEPSPGVECACLDCHSSQDPVSSANTVMRSGEHRDGLAEDEGIIGFEMEGAGVWDNLPCIIIKGVCDYADSHKNKRWQNYASVTAACCTKAFLTYWDTGLQKQQSETPNHPKPSSTVPFERDEMFVGREDIIININNTVQESSGWTSKRAALVGLGGVGKSQIAIEYTYRIRESAPNTWTFWVHASNTTRF
ncbi:hypothetical protein PISL3812_05529 [Talaromyces islandicus]|uniref:Nucleoside phosphorylase domain-containing protein n=1 Tax=Talaromyces islandicus TaxID=28573 RepID=A0A0U1LYT7_TALIS|nr:hypothetical protein PISL3812_05529 [Talaromyces islandicus]